MQMENSNVPAVMSKTIKVGSLIEVLGAGPVPYIPVPGNEEAERFLNEGIAQRWPSMVANRYKGWRGRVTLMRTDYPNREVSVYVRFDTGTNSAPMATASFFFNEIKKVG